MEDEEDGEKLKQKLCSMNFDTGGRPFTITILKFNSSSHIHQTTKNVNLRNQWKTSKKKKKKERNR